MYHLKIIFRKLKFFGYYYLSPGATKRRKLRDFKRGMCKAILDAHLCMAECADCIYRDNEE